MVNTESNSHSRNKIEDSPTHESIREWRSSMETFFNEDWKQVGRIVTSLENSLWENSSLTSSDQSEKQKDHVEVNCKAQIDAMSKPRTPVSSDPEQKMRLENLAKKIEQRLNHADQA